MAKQTNKDRFDSIISKLWLQQQFQQIDNTNALILKRIEEIHKQTTLILLELKRMQSAARFNFVVGPITTKQTK